MGFFGGLKQGDCVHIELYFHLSDSLRYITVNGSLWYLISV